MTTTSRLVKRLLAVAFSSRVFGAVTLFAIVFAIYSVSLANDFINVDDPSYVTTNPWVQAGLRWSGVAWSFGSHAANWHPLTWISHMVDFQVFGSRAWGPHLINILLHSANSALLFLFLTRATNAPMRSFFVAALFGLHPLHVESVAWVSERKDVLSTFFWMLALLSYCAWAPNRGRPKPGNVLIYLLSVFFLACGLLSKSMLVTTPFLLLVLDYWPLGRFSGSKDRAASLRPLLEKVPFFLLSAAVCVVTFVAQRNAGAVGTFTYFPLSARIENAFISYCRYLGKLFWPFDLSIYYPHPGFWHVWQVLTACVLIGSFSAAVWFCRKGYPPAFTGWFWYVGTLIPVIGIVQVGTQSMADRYTYFPSIGVFIMVTWFVADAAHRIRHETVIVGAASAAILLCSILTIRQLGYWRNSGTVFGHAAAAGYECDFVELYYGIALGEQGLGDEAMNHFRIAERLNPRNGYVRLILATALDKKGKASEALEEAREASLLDPSLSKAHFLYGLLLEKEGKANEALEAYQKAADINDDLPFVHYNLGVMLERVGRPKEAIRQYEEELKRNPQLPEAYNNLGKALLAGGRVGEAADAFRNAIRFRPAFAEAHNNLGGALYNEGQTSKAADEFREALRLWPDYEDAKKNLTTVLAGSKK